MTATDAPGCNVSSTICRRSSFERRRRFNSRSTVEQLSAVEVVRIILEEPEGCLKHERNPCRPKDGLHRTLTLVPECDTQDQAIEYLRESVGEIFEGHLDGWYWVPAVWPKNRDLRPFQLWFEFSFHSMIVDVCDDVLEHQEL